MADTLEPQNLRDHFFGPRGTGRLRHTPMRDLIRGRITGRLDWRGRIAAANLPAPIAEVIRVVVKRTRLWRLEKAEVAQELVTHFADGLFSGESAANLINDFGDAKTAATLIRRAKRRNRPLPWQALKWTRRGLLLLAALYGVVFVRFLVGRSNVTVDYVAQLNAATLATPADQRAWPLYRAAFLSMKLDEPGVESPVKQAPDPQGNEWLKILANSRPGDASWPRMIQWSRAHQNDLATVREAARKPSLGFVIGRSGDAEDLAMHWSYRGDDENGSVIRHDPTPAEKLLQNSMLDVLLPYLGSLRQLAELLAADARDAADVHDAARLFDDLVALRGIASQLRTHLVIDQLVSIGIDRLLLDTFASSLRDQPQLLDDAQLVALAHRLSQMGGDTAGTILNLEGERLSFRDMMQRLYTDNGRGDGRLSRDGAGVLPMVTGIVGAKNGWSGAVLLNSVGITSATNARHENLEEFNHLLDGIERRVARPLYEVAGTDEQFDAERRLDEIDRSAIDSVRLLPVRIFAPGLSRTAESIERFLGRRDGVEVGLALELYRRHHKGEYPSSLDQLVAQWLPRVPFDRITGAPLKYRLVDGNPVVYSVGEDRDDDGGRVKVGQNGTADDDAALWPHPEDAGKPPIDADWIVFDARPEPAKTTGR